MLNIDFISEVDKLLKSKQMSYCVDSLSIHSLDLCEKSCWLYTRGKYITRTHFLLEQVTSGFILTPFASRAQPS